MNIQVKILQGNALEYQTDVLALKHAQSLHGVDRKVVDTLSVYDESITAKLPSMGDNILVESFGVMGAKKVLFIGVKSIYYFLYPEIRNFTKDVLSIISVKFPETKQITVTLHGVRYGLDENEVLASEIAGIVDAVAAETYPKQLESITIIEIDQERVNRLTSYLKQLLPQGFIRAQKEEHISYPNSNISERVRTAGSNLSKPYVFVAMPFAESMDDVFHYGIYNAVTNDQVGYLCERADLSSFTGDIMEWVKTRISNSKLVVADLSFANPNVYLEVGYAWGCGVPTVLIVNNEKELKFDVKGQRCLVYKKIMDLEKNLTKELLAMKDSLG